jgi:hypothetical protein
MEQVYCSPCLMRSPERSVLAAYHGATLPSSPAPTPGRLTSSGQSGLEAYA